MKSISADNEHISIELAIETQFSEDIHSFIMNISFH